MIITDKTLDHIAKLSALRLTAEEKRVYLSQLEGILEHMKDLSAVNVDDIAPTYTVIKDHMTIRSGVNPSDANLLQNVGHKIVDNQIVIKSPIKS